MFCPIPWMHLAVRNNGDLRVCCQANQGPDKGLLRRDDGTIYHASDLDIEASRNSQKMKDIRKAFLNNEFHPDCIRCMNEENSGMKSRLSYESENWAHLIDDTKVRAHTKSDGTIDTKKFPAVYYDLRFGNKCNLKCRMCGPTDSSAWYEDNVKLWGINKYDESGTTMEIIQKDGKYTVKNNIYNWYESGNFWKFMEKQIPYVNLVHMVGGEPLMIKEHYKFLDMCVQSGYAKNIRIEYNTNGTIISDNIINTWKKFKRVQFGVSIDGIKQVNDYIRYPSKWNNVQKNLKTMCDIGDNVVVWTSLTVSMMNILHLPDYLEYISTIGIDNLNTFKNNSLGATHPLHGPKHLNVKAFPKEIKYKIKEYFDSYKFTKCEKEARKVLNRYIKFMFQEDYDIKMFNKFLLVMNRLDEIRGQSLKKSIPDLYKIIENYNNE